MEASKSRVAAFDIAKGIAIVLVVYGHCLRGLLAGNMIEPTVALRISDYAIYTFHMPLFFVISGYFLDRSGSRSFGAVWRGRIRTIVYPYFLWSLVHGGLLYAVSGSGMANNAMPLSRLMEIGWSPISPYWFLYALFFAYVLAALLRKMPATWMTASALVCFLGLFAAGPSVLFDIAYAFFYLCVGILARERELLTRLPSTAPGLVLVWFGFALSTSASYALGIPERLPLPSAFLGLAALMSTCRYLERRHLTATTLRVLEFFGQCSMGIFVMHIIVLAAVRIVLLRILHVADPFVLLAVGTAAGVLLPAAFQVLAIRLGIQDMIGLPSTARPYIRRAAILKEAENRQPSR